jgi:hypothetical protein
MSHKDKEWRWFSNTWQYRITSNSSSSTLSNTLSMGKDLKDEKEKVHVEYKDHLQHKMLIIIFPC